MHCPATIAWFYDPDYLVGYIFVSNLIISVVQMFFFIPELRGFAYKLDRVLLKRMVVYSFPVLILGLVGILNQTVDKMIYPFLFEDRQEGLAQLSIYAATCKIAMVMAMFTQAFRYAYEPFVFGKDSEGDNRKMYAAAMKYFLIFSLLAFLAVMFYLDLLRYLVAKDYWEGLGVVSIVMLAEICKGIYFNLSFWYKLTDKTYWGGLLLSDRLCHYCRIEHLVCAGLWLSCFGMGFCCRLCRNLAVILLDRTERIPDSL